MVEGPVKAGTVELADGSTVDYEESEGERVAWVMQIHFKTCGHAETRPSGATLMAAGFRRLRRMAYVNAGGRCPACVGKRAAEKVATPAAAAAPTPPKIRQNVPTGIPCPKPGCKGKLLIMTRKADGRQFMACSAWYGDVKCDYTQNTIPEHVKAKQAGIPMLELPGLG